MSAFTEFSADMLIFGVVDSFGLPVMHEDEDKTLVQTKKDLKRLKQELFGEDYEDDPESDTEFDITRTD